MKNIRPPRSHHWCLRICPAMTYEQSNPLVTHLSHQSTKAFVLALKKCASSVWSQLTACLMSGSVANLSASQELLMVAKIWKSPEVRSKLHREMFHNLLAIVLYLLTVWGPVISISLDTLRCTWLGRKFATNTTAKQAVTSCLQTHDTDFFYTRIQALVP